MTRASDGTSHERLVELFARAVELAPAERAAFVDRVCRDETERSALLALLRGDADEGVLPRDGPAPWTDDEEHATSPFPERVGRYAIVRELGRGAMGRVLLARQEQTDQLVALKLVRASAALLTPTVGQRFARETRVLGRLSHSGIARILDAGAADIEGCRQPYLAMEYVEGRQLLDYAREERLGVRERLALLAQLCDALQHAHDRGVVHRDLKPDNVVVTAAGVAKVLDFGVARLAGAEAQLTTVRTGDAQLIGTLAYMSPEQASGSTKELDGRSDVYSLGVIGYELLGGRRPHRLEELDFVAAVRVVREDDPVTLSTVVPEVPRDAATIVHKALAKEPERRYPTAEAFAKDVRRFLADEPIAARPASTFYVLRKLTRRHRGLVAGLATAFAVLVVGTIVSLVFATRALRASEAARWEAYLATLAAGSAELHAGSIERARERLDQAPPEHRGVEWRILRGLAEPSLRCLRGHGYNVWNVALSPDGTRAYSCAGDATVRVWDVASGEPLQVLRDHADRVFSVAASPDGTRLASGSADKTIRLRDARTYATVAVLEGHDDGAFGLAFSRDGRLLASGANNGTLRLWRAEDGELVRVLEGHPEWIWSIEFAPDDRTFATASADGSVRLWDPATGERVAAFDSGEDIVVDVSFGPDGSFLALGTTGGELQLWDVARATRTGVVAAHEAELGSIALAPDGRHAVTGARDGTLAIWSVPGLEEVARRRAHTDWVQSLCFAGDGATLVSGAWDDTVRVWDARRLEERVAPDARAGIRSFDVAGAADARHAFVLDADGARVVDLLTGARADTRDASPEASSPWLVAFRAPADDDDTRVRVFDALRGRTVGEVGRLGPFALDAVGRRLVATDTSRRELAWFDVESGARGGRLELEAADVTIHALAVDPRGRWAVASGPKDCSVLVWHLATGRLTATLRAHVDTVTHIAFDASGDLIATSGVDRVTYLWSAEATGAFEQVGTLAAHGAPVRGAAFDPAGERIVTWTEDGRVRVWSRATLEELAVLPVTSEPITRVQFTRDGRLLVVGDAAGALHVLDGR